MLTTPFHPRTSVSNETGMWGHWSGYLATIKYQASEKFEYFAIRDRVGMFDTSHEHGVVAVLHAVFRSG